MRYLWWLKRQYGYYRYFGASRWEALKRIKLKSA